MNKRGLSNVIVTLILIVISLIAVGLVWVAVQNLIESETEQISLGFIIVDLEIKDVKVNEANDIEVKVKRKIGEGEITGLKFIVSDGVNTETIDKENINLDELEEKTFTITSGELGEVVFVKEISVAPVFKLESGKEKIGNVVDKFEFKHRKLIYDKISTSICSTLGWTVGSGGTAECGESDLGFSCTSSVNLIGARNTCENIGARLCTKDEINAGAAKGTGCGFDAHAVWTSTECGSEGFYLIQGDNGTINYCEEDISINSPTQQIFTTNLIGVRCCADS